MIVEGDYVLAVVHLGDSLLVGGFLVAQIFDLQSGISQIIPDSHGYGRLGEGERRRRDDQSTLFPGAVQLIVGQGSGQKLGCIINRESHNPSHRHLAVVALVQEELIIPEYLVLHDFVNLLGQAGGYQWHRAWVSHHHQIAGRDLQILDLLIQSLLLGRGIDLLRVSGHIQQSCPAGCRCSWRQQG